MAMQTRPTGFPSSSGSGPATPVIETATLAGGPNQRSFRHGDRDLTANRTLALQEVSGHPERLDLVGLGIGDEAAVQTFGCAGRLGEMGGKLPGGTRLSGNDGGVSLRGSFEGALREAGEINRGARRATAACAFRPMLR
jgi:hypothetical protein